MEVVQLHIFYLVYQPFLAHYLYIILSNINEKVIGIGETGIDLYHSNEFISFQMESFQNHIDASLESNLPLIIHMRNSENELIKFLIKQKKLPKVVMHCFSGSYDYLKKCIGFVN